MNATAEQRIAILARMAKRVPRLGRTQVMKLFYFLQELKGVSLGYDFGLFNYGPFQSEVLSDLSLADGLGIVVEKTVATSRGYGYNIEPGPSFKKTVDIDDGIISAVDEVIKEFGNSSAAELELLSTIHFVNRESHQDGNSLNDDQLSERVHQIKPHFSEEIILDRITAMRKKGWL